MTKKQHNRKNVTQNKRNKIINRRYISTIKTLFKFFLITKEKKSFETKKETFEILKNLYSIIDKAVKKKVIHKNTAARKKSKISKIYSQL